MPPISSSITDFHDEESLQRIVKVNLTGNLMVTGGADGCIRLWEFPLKETSDMKPLKEYKGHTKEIDDIDISANSMFIVSVAKDGNAFHWNTSNNAKTSLVHPNNIKQTFKRCKFGIINKQLFNIYTIANRANQKSYLQRWSNENKLLYEFQYSEPTSALAVREDGFYIAVGTMFSGTVSIHEAHNLKLIYNVKQAHAMFVTGLEFLSKDLMPEMNASVLSISVDNRICLHNVPIKPLKPFWKMLLIMHFILLVIYIIIFNLGIN
ncbi:prolactin regulatory element-binding protein isoform X2 [Daktulosphaira vitifoliae]|uniref:prolactin regulatory element-binding protein isoform X2 n=1 Tax=Daktulosphaira vitifoliae TaxID=58002 RepID=UPI0021A9D0EE|nr:prolactin regulatory element-binding protein isoform X2 [Daktulosphaira vitifoliae]